jgi:agmatinase
VGETGGCSGRRALEENSLSTPHNYCGLDQTQGAFETARVVVLPVPYDGTASYVSGSQAGPRAIITASRNLELYDDELSLDISTVGIHTLPELDTQVSGPEEMVLRVRDTTDRLLQDKFVVMLGGDHILSVGPILAHAEQCKNLSVLQLDAHADLRDTYEGNPYSHACTMRRVVDHVPYVGVGIRSLSTEEAEIAASRSISLFYAREGLDDSTIRKVVNRLSENVYVTIDMDVFDPSQVPSVGTPEPGGLDWYSITDLLRTVSKQRQVVGFDLTELCPISGLVAPDFLAAKLVYRFLGYIHRSG